MLLGTVAARDLTSDFELHTNFRRMSCNGVMMSRNFYALSRYRCDPRLRIQSRRWAHDTSHSTRGGMTWACQTRAHTPFPDIHARLKKVSAAQPVYGYFRRYALCFSGEPHVIGPPYVCRYQGGLIGNDLIETIS